MIGATGRFIIRKPFPVTKLCPVLSLYPPHRSPCAPPKWNPRSTNARDFKRYARKEIPEEFAVFRDVYKCNLEHKTYLDENHTVHGIKALFVGHYRTRKGGPPVWAQTTTIGVRYFSGKPVESVCAPIPEQHVSRIHYAAPYNIVLGAQEGGSRTAGRKAGHDFVETIFNVLFLLVGQIEQLVADKDKFVRLENTG